MSQIFPRWSNRLPLYVALGIVSTIVLITGAFWYFGSPLFLEVGYEPYQPVPYSHKLHAGDLGLDCRYCHTTVERAATASIPPTQTCMNCHQLIKPESEKLALIRESWTTGQPMQWVRVHKIPDYAYFNHSAHIYAGVGCASCHGKVNEMEIVRLAEPLSMSWCLNCHRNPDNALRPREAITDMDWVPPANQAALAHQYKLDRNIDPGEDCSVCHR